MNYMQEIIVPRPDNETLLSQLSSLYQALKGIPAGAEVKFNISDLSWVSPALLLPLTAYVYHSNSEVVMNDRSALSKNYLKAISFPEGVDSVSEFQQKIQEQKTYIPISLLKRDSQVERERLETLFGKMVYQVLGEIEGARSAIYYPINELVTNIFEHSQQDTGFIFGQYYPSKKYLDICIADCGLGLANVYKEELGMTLSDHKAIKEVMKGHSTKMSKERGFGVRTSKRVVCEGLGGSFALISGGGALISENTEDTMVDLPNFYWQGVIVMYRIPRMGQPIDITPYVE